VLRAIGPEQLVVVATPSKVAALGGRPLLVDTGDPELDASLSGYRRVITGVGREAVLRVLAG
jgi:predicted polyphosphate/ATP-dependent NAD kinase